MYLSNRLTFSLVFPILLFAAFTFVVVPAMGSGLVVQYEAELTPAQDDEDGKWEVTFDFQQAAGSFTKNDFITGSGDDEMINVALGASDFSDDDDRVDKDKFSYANNVLTVPIPMTDETADQSPAIAFQVTGYALQTQSSNTTAAVTMDPAEPSLRGKGYLIFTRTVTEAALPELPSSVDTIGSGSDTEILAWTGAAQTGLERGLDSDLNLEEFFHVGGGAIHLKIIDMVDHDDDTATPDQATAMTTQNSKHLVINEVMWAVDDRLVGQTGYLYQQWIEVYNTSSIPVPLDRIVFETAEVHPTQNAGASDLPDGTSDSLSNIPKFNTIWSVLGSSGSSTLSDDSTPVINGANPPFVSMYRNNAGKDGWEAGQWTVSGRPYLNGFYGTPGGANTRGGLPGARPDTPTVTPPMDKIVINEIGKSKEENEDWIELKNVTDSDQSLKGYSLTITTGLGNETQIIDFADADKILANGHLLLLNSHPDENKHIRGFDIRTDAGAQLFGVNEADSHRYLVVGNKEIQIPADDKWLLILRSDQEDKLHQSSHNIHDVAGPGGGHDDFIVQDRGAVTPRKDKNGKGEDGKGAIWHTRVWPLNGQNAGNKNNLLRHDHADDAIPLGVDDKVWTRDTSKQGYAHGAFSAAGYTGIGYDRKTPNTAVNGGTPGYPNDTVKSTLADIGGKLIISELMLNNDGGRAPQWIELQNTSATHAIMFGDPDGDDPLKPWTIEFENYNSGTWKSANRPLNIGFNLSDLFDSVPPGQTLLIVSTTLRGSALSNPDHFPPHRVASIEQHKKKEFGLANKRDMFLNGEGGFTITIKDSSGAISDMIGNLDGKAASLRDDIPLDAPFGWNWSTALAEDGSRTSLLRLKNEDGTPVLVHLFVQLTMILQPKKMKLWQPI